MQVVRFLRELSAGALSDVHKGRREALWSAVGGVLRGGQLSLTHIGRCLETKAYEKHAIKRVDRLLGNAHLWRERTRWYRWIARQTISPSTHSIILVD